MGNLDNKDNSGKNSRSYSILIIDDQMIVAETLADILKHPGYKIITETDPKKALQRLDEQVFDLVITDWVMPEISGDAILQKVKSIEDRFILAIIVTGQATLDNAIQALQLGAYDYITKPFNRGQIKAVVRNALQRIDLENKNRLLNERIKKLLNNMTLLYDISSILYQVSELEAAQEMILDTFREYFKLHHIGIALEDEASAKFKIEYATGLSEAFRESFIFETGDKINNQTIAGNALCVVDGLDGKIRLNRTELEVAQEESVLYLFPLQFRDRTIGFLVILSAKPLDSFLTHLIKVYSTQIAPVLYSFFDHRQNEIISDSYIYKIIKEAMYQAQMVLSPLSFILFRVVIKEKCNGSLLLNDVVKTYRNYFKSRCTKGGELIWLTLDTALLILPEEDLFAAESLSSELAQALETLPVGSNKQGVLSLQYACAGYPQLGEDAREIYSMLWVKLLEENNLKSIAQHNIF